LIFFLVLFLVGWALIKYRGKPGDPEPPQVYGNNKLEIAWTVVPTIIVADLA
jgi:cytochrome c oxidase subunit 2